MLRIFHWPAIFLTLIGPIGLVLLCASNTSIKEAWRIFRGPTPKQIETSTEKQSRILHRISEDYYSRGNVVFHHISTQGLSPIIQAMIERLSMRIPPQDVRNLLIRDRAILEGRFEAAINIPSLGVRLAPSIGMLGTILGMTKLLSHLKDPASLGSHMSLALLTTFYGLLVSLTLWTPIEHYLSSILRAHERGLDQAEHWIELLERRKPAQYFASELEQMPTPPQTKHQPELRPQ